MLFDIRGRRKRVVQVAYAGLALVMALSLFTVVGPAPFGDIFGGGASSTDPSEIYDDQIQRIERKLAKEPQDQALLVQLTRTQFQAANAQIERDPATNQITGIPEQAVSDFRATGGTWERYLKTDPKPPNPTVAGFVAQAEFYSAVFATTGEQFEQSLDAAVAAQGVYAEARPSLSAYVTLAQYSYFGGDEEGGDAAARRAQQLAPKSQRTTVKQATDSYAKQGKQVQEQVKAQSKFNPGAGVKQALQDPLGGLSGGSGLSAPSP